MSHPAGVSCSDRAWLKPWIYLLVCLVWLLPGLTGHDPWKPDEAYGFGLIYHIVRSGDWVVPTLGGEPFMEKPPLYFLTAALFVHLLSPPLALHDAARLTSAFYMAITLLCLAFTARHLYAKERAWPAVMAFVGCFGLLLPAHQILTDLAMVSGTAMGLLGLAMARSRPVAGGILLGTGAGVGFMSKGLLAPGLLGVTAVAMLAFPAWRARGYVRSLGVAAIAVLPWVTIWPFALYRRSPQLFVEWLWINNFGRFLGFAPLGPTSEPFFYLLRLPYLAWPAVPFALWTLWRNRLRCLTRAELQLPCVFLAVALGVLSLSSSARELYALPLLLPIALLAAVEMESLPRRLEGALYGLGLGFFALAACVLWVIWAAVDLGVPAAVAARLTAFQPGYQPTARPLALGFAITISLGWLALMALARQRPGRALLGWSSGVALAWALAATLLLPWLNTGMSYRGMLMSLKRALPAQYRCMESHGLGEPQRALLDYYLGITTHRHETGGKDACDLILWQGSARENTPWPEGRWRLLWQGARPGDTKERYWLFQREGAA
ncbi:ArnT family glycosyltransferase [Thiobacter aerophilum]|uniref:Glycosyltransferase RgtA/B/C/D-like domain-containing protein n=1 Tax=Thiobacter aerophilum TaxID=3121275 RepID=A0ABV0EE18_9BURK